MRSGTCRPTAVQHLLGGDLRAIFRRTPRPATRPEDFQAPTDRRGWPGAERKWQFPSEAATSGDIVEISRSPNPISPISGCNRPGNDVHERRFAGTVLSENGVNFAGIELDAHVAQRWNAGIELRNARQPDRHVAVRRRAGKTWLHRYRHSRRRFRLTDHRIGHCPSMVVPRKASASGARLTSTCC